MVSVLLNKCCCCIPLKVGAFIIGYVFSISKTIMLFLTCIYIMQIKIMTMQSPELLTPDIQLLRNLSYAIAFAYTLQMLFSVNLLVGLHKKQLKHVKKFYIVYPFLVVCVAILLIISMASFGKDYTLGQWLMHLADLFIILIECYSIFIVRRCYLKLNSENGTNQGMVFQGNRHV